MNLTNDKKNSIARIVNGKIVYGKHAEIIKPNETAARSRRQEMKATYRKELLQPNQTDFYRVYKDKAKDLPEGTQRLLS